MLTVGTENRFVWSCQFLPRDRLC